MPWKIRIRRNGEVFHYATRDLQAAIAVTCLLLRDGMMVERIEGPEGLMIGSETVRPLCDGVG